MLFSDDVVDFMSEQPILLMHKAVFATLPCPISDFAS